jgi:chemotaxis protein methyltransferase CheR
MIEIGDFHNAKRLLLMHAGIDLNMSKQQMVFNRLIKPMRQLNYANMADFLADVETSRNLQQHFVNALTTNVTSFFREAHHFPVLNNHSKNMQAELRLWSAGCSTGQEPYSMLISLIEAYPTLAHAKAPFILATDIDTTALAIAERGIYSSTEMKGLSDAQKKQFFNLAPNDSFEVKEVFRRLISFQTFNLASEKKAPWQRFNAIFCRNVMIYFGPEIQRTLVSQFTEYLRPEGLLFSGHAEMLLHSDSLLSSVGQTVYAVRRGAP